MLSLQSLLTLKTSLCASSSSEKSVSWFTSPGRTLVNYSEKSVSWFTSPGRTFVNYSEKSVSWFTSPGRTFVNYTNLFV